MQITSTRTIKAPSNCPSCGSSLEWVNDTLYCMNPDCYAKNSKRVEHWAKTLKIKGLGPATIEKLNLQSVEEIYQLDLISIVERLGSEKLAKKLYDEIQASTNASLEEVLPAFGIPLIGDTASKKLCKVIAKLEDLDSDVDVCEEAGLGPKARQNLYGWWSSFREQMYDWPLEFRVKKRFSSGSKGIVCISGKLVSFKNKAEAAAALESAGYTVKDNLTKDVTILINEGGVESTKTKKAKENGITIVTNIRNLLGDFNE